MRELLRAAPAGDLPELGVVKGDPSDDVYLATALVGAARRVLTGGQRHLLRLREFAGDRIVNPAEFLEELRRA